MNVKLDLRGLMKWGISSYVVVQGSFFGILVMSWEAFISQLLI